MLGIFHFQCLGFLAAFVYACVYFARRIREHHEIQALGGYSPKVPSRLPLGMEVVWQFVRCQRRHEDLKAWYWIFSHSNTDENKTVECSIGGQRMIFTADPDNIRAVLATQFGDYGKGEPFHEDWKDFLGDSIFTTDGQQWSESRNLLRPLFMKQRVRDFEIFERHTQKLIGLIGAKGQLIDISELFYRYTLDTATDYLLGASVNSLDKEDNDFTTHFDEVQRVQSLVARAGPFNRLVPRKSFNEGMSMINNYINFFINRVPSPSALEKDTKEEGYTFLHALSRHTSSKKVMRDQLVAVLLAGRDTTAGTLSFLFAELSRHPQVLAKLRKEILDTIGPNKEPSFDDIRNCSYLQHTITETLRLYPAVPYNVRLALKDTTLPRGGGPDGKQPIGILKNTPISYSTIFLQRNPHNYPPITPKFADIETFHPDRWNHWAPKPWTYIPFNGGPRICIGQQFALTEIGYTIVRLLQRFERIERYWTDEELILSAEIVLSPVNGVKVGFWEVGAGGSR